MAWTMTMYMYSALVGREDGGKVLLHTCAYKSSCKGEAEPRGLP
jgi:hypothetical protein